jgi:hypothetical protein
MGLESGPAQSLNAGISAQPLVTPLQPVVTPSAVSALTDAFRQGFITSKDVFDTIGPVGQAKKKAELTGLDEFTSPDALAARKATLQAQAAQAQLAQATASANTGLVQPTADLQAANIQKQKEEVLSKNAIDAWTQWNLPIYNEDGTPNYDAMKQAGMKYVRANSMLSYANQGLTGQRVETKDPKTGQPKYIILNSMGQDVSPDTADHKHYSDMRREAWNLFMSEPDIPEAPKPAANGASAPAAPAAPAASKPLITPNAASSSASAAPVIQPWQGISAGPVPGTTVPEVMATAGQDPTYTGWKEKVNAIGKFHDAATQIDAPINSEYERAKLGPINLPVMRTRDLALVSAMRQLATPTVSSSVRGAPEFQMKEFEEELPKVEALLNAPGKIAGTSELTPELRTRLIRLGNTYVKNLETHALPPIQRAEEVSGFPASHIWGSTSPEHLLRSGVSSAYRGKSSGDEATAAAPPSGVVGGRKLVQVGPHTFKYVGDNSPAATPAE